MTTIHISNEYNVFSDSSYTFIWSKNSSSADNVRIYSVPQWIDNNIERLRAELAKFTHDLALLSVSNKPLHRCLQINDELSHWWCSLIYEKHPKMLPELYSIFKLRALECMIEQFVPQCEKIILHINNKKLHKALMQFCETNNIEYEYEGIQKDNKKRHSIVKKIIAALPYSVQALIRFLHWLFLMRKILFKKRVNYRNQNACTIATYFPNIHKDKAGFGIFRSHYWEDLHDILPENIYVNWLLIRVNSAQYSFKECLKLHNKFDEKYTDRASFYYLEEFLSLKDIVKACYHYVKMLFLSFYLAKIICKNCYFPSSLMPLWTYFKPYWHESLQGWRSLERCLQKTALDRYAQQIGEQKFTLFPWENCPWERMLTHAMKKQYQNKPVYAALHSCLRPTDFRYFDDARIFKTDDIYFIPDLYLINSEKALDALQKAGIPKNKLQKVEALRYTHLIKKYNSAQQISAQSIYIITSFFEDEIDYHIETLAKWLKNTNTSYKIYIKSHPHKSAQAYLNKYLNPSIINSKQCVCTKKSIAQIYSEVSINREKHIVWLSNSTTVALELVNIPLFIQGAKDNFNLCPLQYYCNINYIYNADDLQECNIVQHEGTCFILNKNLTLWREILKLNHVKI